MYLALADINCEIGVCVCVRVCVCAGAGVCVCVCLVVVWSESSDLRIQRRAS